MSDASPPPRVTIGLPVRNGMPLLVDSLESLLAQDQDGLEIVVSDNASDDGTEAYCRDLAERDGRVRYSRNPEDVGAAANFQRVLDLATAPYFAWAAHDDRYHPSFVSSCLEALAARPDAGLCVPAHRRVDERGETLSIREEPVGLASADLETRLRAHLWRRGWITIYGLWRTELLRRVGPPPPVWGHDVVLVWKALLLAPAETLAEPLTDYRVVRAKRAETVMLGITPSRSAPPFANSGMLASLRQGADELPLSAAERRVAARVLDRWRFTRHYRELVATDLIEQSRRLRDRGAVLRAGALLAPAALLGPRMALQGMRHVVSVRSGDPGVGSTA